MFCSISFACHSVIVMTTAVASKRFVIAYKCFLRFINSCNYRENGTGRLRTLLRSKLVPWCSMKWTATELSQITATCCLQNIISCETGNLPRITAELRRWRVMKAERRRCAHTCWDNSCFDWLTVRSVRLPTIHVRPCLLSL